MQPRPLFPCVAAQKQQHKNTVPHVCSAHTRAFLWPSSYFAFKVTQHTGLDTVTEAQIALPALMTSLRKNQ